MSGRVDRYKPVFMEAKDLENDLPLILSWYGHPSRVPSYSTHATDLSATVARSTGTRKT